MTFIPSKRIVDRELEQMVQDFINFINENEEGPNGAYCIGCLK